MYAPGVAECKQTRRDSWLKATSKRAQAIITAPNVVGMIACAVLLFLLLVPPMPWDIRLPLYFAVLVCTILRPRTALNLCPFPFPGGRAANMMVTHLHSQARAYWLSFLSFA